MTFDAVQSVLETIATWDVPNAAAVVVDSSGVIAQFGDLGRRYRIASISKVLVGYAAMIAVEEGTLSLDQPAGPEGSTIRHLLAHASGYPFFGELPLAALATRRIYSNTGFDEFGRAFGESVGMSITEYLADGIFDPLAMTSSALEGSPAKDVWSPASDLAKFVAELLHPTLISQASFAEWTTEQFPGLAGVLPELGSFRPNPWGIGVELRGSKQPHWTGSRNSDRTFGHFGGSGTFLWVDPALPLAVVALTDREFGPWSLDAWPVLSDGIIAAYRNGRVSN
jgi:CubicO group peptidase (beta-lactamase class C family)